MSQVNKGWKIPTLVCSTDKELRIRRQFPTVKRYCTLKDGKKIEIKLVSTTVKGLRGKTFYEQV